MSNQFYFVLKSDRKEKAGAKPATRLIKIKMKLYVFEGPSAPDESSLTFDITLSDLAASGLKITRHDVIMDPEAFACHTDAAILFEQEGPEALPIIAIDDIVMSWETYPDRDEVLSWFDVAPPCEQNTGQNNNSRMKNCASCAAENCPSAKKQRIPNHD